MLVRVVLELIFPLFPLFPFSPDQHHGLTVGFISLNLYLGHKFLLQSTQGKMGLHITIQLIY